MAPLNASVLLWQLDSCPYPNGEKYEVFSRHTRPGHCARSAGEFDVDRDWCCTRSVYAGWFRTG